MLKRKSIDLDAPYTIPLREMSYGSITQLQILDRPIVVDDYVILITSDGCQFCSQPCKQQNQIAKVKYSCTDTEGRKNTCIKHEIDDYSFLGFEWCTGAEAEKSCHGSGKIYANRFKPIFGVFTEGVSF